MKKAINIGLILLTGLMIWGGAATAEEAGWFQPADGWIIRVYTSGTGPYAVNLEVMDTNNQLIDPADIVGLTTNPQQVIGNASSPDISFAFDENTGTAYVIYTNALGSLALQEVADITSGAPPAVPQISVSPNSVAFGTVKTGAFKDGTVTVSNTGSGNLNITSIVISGASTFTVAGGTCAVGTPVAPGGTCTIIVRFRPLAMTTYNGSLTINSNGGNAAVTLSGTGSYF